jgi:hypothetical protein
MHAVVVVVVVVVVVMVVAVVVVAVVVVAVVVVAVVVVAVVVVVETVVVEDVHWTPNEPGQNARPTAVECVPLWVYAAQLIAFSATTLAVASHERRAS